MAAQGGGYEIGYELRPLTEADDLDTSGDFTGGPHLADVDPLYNLACQNRDAGNKMVKEGRPEEAIAKYSEMIMQLRALCEEEKVEWNDGCTEAVRQLRAAAYLNLSLCFLKTQQWTHASNTATRAIQGDKEPPVAAEAVLSPEKKAKALFRRAQAQSEGFGNYDKAKADLEKALELAPEDTAVQQELRRIRQIQSKSEKTADKKMAGFLSKSKKAQAGEGIFDSKVQKQDVVSGEESAVPKLKDIKKLSDGLWLAPKDETQKQAEDEPDGEDNVDFEELTREINEMKEERPEVFNELRERVQKHIEEVADKTDKETAAAESPAEAA